MCMITSKIMLQKPRSKVTRYCTYTSVPFLKKLTQHTDSRNGVHSSFDQYLRVFCIYIVELNVTGCEPLKYHILELKKI